MVRDLVSGEGRLIHRRKKKERGGEGFAANISLLSFFLTILPTSMSRCTDDKQSHYTTKPRQAHQQD